MGCGWMVGVVRFGLWLCVRGLVLSVGVIEVEMMLCHVMQK